MTTATRSWKPSPLLGITVGWVSGCALVWSNAVPFAFEAVTACVLLLFLALMRHSHGRSVIIASLLAMLWASAWWLYDVSLMRVDPAWLQSPQLLSGTVVQATRQEAMQRIRLKQVVLHQASGDVVVAGGIDAYDWGRNRHTWQPGDRVRLTARLKLPRNHHNPGGFDYQNYCFEHHIAMTASVRGTIELEQAGSSALQQLRQRIRDAMPASPLTSGVLQALILGDREHIPLAVQDAFAASGAAHLLAISGLHIGMVAAWGGALMWWLLTRRERWIIHYPVRLLSLLAGVVVALAYATLADWPLPTQRAVLMLLAAACAWWWRMRYPPFNILCFSLCLMLLWQPAAVLSLSLWLSFTATAALLLLLNGMEQQGDGSNRIHRYLRGLLLVSLCASLATLPLIVDVFGRIPLWTLPANLLLVPLYALWILPFALLAVIATVFSLGMVTHHALIVAGWGVELGNAVLQFLFTLPGGNFWVADVPPGISIVYGLFLLIAGWFVHQRRWKTASGWMACGLLLYLGWVIPEHPPRSLQWVVWDVGQGAASSWLQPDGTVLQIDVPGSPGSRFNGGTTVAAGLRTLGVVHVDMLCLSHAQSDHAGGVLRLLASLRHTGTLCLADTPSNRQWPMMQQAVSLVKQRGGEVRWLHRGDRLQLGALQMEVLWPPAAYAPSNTNNASLVLSLRLPDGERVLLGGDMEAPVEREILADGLPPHAWMLMPHHGSRTSSTTALLEAAQPRVAVAQTGYANHWHFPASSVLARYRQYGTHIDNTADGAVIYRWDDGAVERQQPPPLEHAKYTGALQWVASFL